MHTGVPGVGGDNQRLHEELIFAGGELREGRFTRIQQLERDRGSLQRRLAELPKEEVAEEAKLIRARYASPTPRLFPVSVTYLVPGRLAK